MSVSSHDAHASVLPRPALAPVPERAGRVLPKAPFARVLALTVIAFFVHLGANFWRGPASVLEPALVFEDGRDIFAFYYDDRSVSSVLRFYGGYVSLVPNSIGYLVMGLPTELAAILLRVVPWALNALALSLFVLPAFRAVVPSDICRLAISLGLALFPMQDFGMVTMTMYSLWSLLLIQWWLAALPAPRNTGALAASVAFQAGASWSNPLSMLLLPLYGARFFSERRNPRAWVAVGVPVVAILTYFAFGIAHDGTKIRPSGVHALLLAADYMAQRVFFELFGSSFLRTQLPYHGLGFVPRLAGGALALALVGGIAFAHRRGVLSESTKRVCLFAAFLVPAATLFFVTARNPEQELFESAFGQRYFFLQKVALVFVLVCVAWDAIPVVKVARPRWARAWPIVALTGFVHLGMVNAFDRFLYMPPPGESATMRSFLERLQTAEARGTHERVRLERGEWTISVTAR